MAKAMNRGEECGTTTWSGAVIRLPGDPHAAKAGIADTAFGPIVPLGHIIGRHLAGATP